MSAQLDLFAAPAAEPVAIDTGLTCSFGEPWMGPHPLCEAETERGCRAFAEAVARGEFNERGYTPREWAAYQKTQKTSQ